MKKIKGLIEVAVLILSFFAGLTIGALLLAFVVCLWNINIPKPLESNIGLYALVVFVPIISGCICASIAMFILKKMLPSDEKIGKL